MLERIASAVELLPGNVVLALPVVVFLMEIIAIAYKDFQTHSIGVLKVYGFLNF